MTQIAALEKQFINGGGYSEQLAAARLAERERKKKNPSDQTDRTDRLDPSNRIPACPRCGKPMVLRTAKSGEQSGQLFWGCSAYPACKGLVKL
ncbi:MAG: topoisomerase DNA-binding C4 zinc finger domain-containing protein [Lentisphaerae bacterium]|nr:topoisomerase DNA-binding C4 zinc finger domain-containing protein [Lentisphaerota bacterium]